MGLGFIYFYPLCISPAGRRLSPRGSAPTGEPPEGTLTLHFIPIVISDDDDEGENEEELNEMCDWMDEQNVCTPIIIKSTRKNDTRQHTYTLLFFIQAHRK